jgi:hypothetical protein
MTEYGQISKITEKIKELESTKMWAWIGIISSVLSGIIAIRSINKYIRELKEK